MESRRKPCMETTRSVAWHQSERKNTRWCVMPYAYGDSMHLTIELLITAKPWMESRRKPCMETTRSVAWHQSERKNTRWCVMPYACGDSMHDCVVIAYQSFGLDRKKTVLQRSFFLVHLQGLEPWTH